LLDKNKVIKQNKYFRLFATSNTVGLGDTSGLYHGTQQINQGQMDRWNIVTTLNYLSLEKEMEIILAKNKSYNNAEGKEKISNMIKVATLTRKGFIAGDISTVMSPRTVLHWADNAEIFKNLGYAFRVTFLNKCDESEKNIISEYYQAHNYERFVSLDLDNNHHNNYLSKNNISENLGFEKQFISSLIELIGEEKMEKPRYQEKENINQMDNLPKNQILNDFDLLDKSLENLLLNLSYNINQELFKANLIKKMIFLYLIQEFTAKKIFLMK